MYYPLVGQYNITLDFVGSEEEAIGFTKNVFFCL